MKKLITLALAALSLTACAKQPKEMYGTDEFQTQSGKTVRFHALVHSSIRIEFDGKEIEVESLPNSSILTFESDIMNNASLNIHVNYDKDYLQTN